MSQCLGVIDCKLIEVEQLLASFHRLDNRKRKHSLNEQVLCDIECDMRVVGWTVELLGAYTVHIDEEHLRFKTVLNQRRSNVTYVT